ncbi:MAG: hypothetical protein V3V72_11315 [Ignavibacteriaceae bacterium]
MPINRRIFINSLPEIGKLSGLIEVMYPTLSYLKPPKSVTPKISSVNAG